MGKTYLRLRDALRKGAELYGIQAIGNWYGSTVKAGDPCKRLPAACVMGSLFKGGRVLVREGDGKYENIGLEDMEDSDGRALNKMFPFLNGFPTCRHPAIDQDDWDQRGYDNHTLLDVSISLNDQHELERGSITAWLEIHELEWIKDNPILATHEELVKALKMVSEMNEEAETFPDQKGETLHQELEKVLVKEAVPHEEQSRVR